MSNLSTCCCVEKTIDEVIVDIKKTCKKRRVSLTDTREKVLRLLLEEGKSIKAYDLLDKMTQVHPKAKPPTVYRALDFLVAEGLAHRIDSTNSWSACHHINHHHHDLIVVCTSCGLVQEVDVSKSIQPLYDLLNRQGFSIMKTDMEIQAICDQCKQKEQK